MNPFPTVAIVGRPNVGKSTLFNRLTHSRQAITADEPGTTRDRITRKLEIDGYNVMLVDTGGLENGKSGNIEADIQSQAQIAIADADLILFIIDGLQEMTSDDFLAANILRRSKKETLLIANKCDNPESENKTFNLYELGFGEPICVSAIHKLGVEKMETEIGKKLKKLKFKKSRSKKKLEENTGINLCILGQPNAGKSSLVNALLGEEKLITSDIPGTTRDTTDSEVEINKQKYTLIDTAGLRRRGRIERGIEKFSALRALQAIDRSDVVILLIDAAKNITSQDAHIIEFALDAKKGLVIALNKSDLLDEETRDRIVRRMRYKFTFIPWAPVIFISAKNKKNIDKVYEITKEIYDERAKRVTTSQLNDFMQRVTFKHPPSSTKIRKPKFLYGTQADINPPKFVLFFKNATNIHFSYKRYIENEIRKEYGFGGTALNIDFRNKVGDNDDRKF